MNDKDEGGQPGSKINEATSDKNFVQKLDKQTILGGLGIILLAVGLVSLIILSSRQSSQVEIIPAQENDSAADKKIIFVDIAGAVQKPGLYQLDSKARLNDALVSAGGLSAQADREWVAKNINLASPLKDGIKIYIKLTNDINLASVGQAQVLSTSTEAKININTADLGQLDQLPGIGPAIGQRIIDYRTEKGSFTTPEDLMKVSGVGQKLFDKLKDRVTVW